MSESIFSVEQVVLTLHFLVFCYLSHMEFGRWSFYPICYDSRLAVVIVQLVASPAPGRVAALSSELADFLLLSFFQQVASRTTWRFSSLLAGCADSDFMCACLLQKLLI